MNSERITLLKQFIADEPSNPFNKYALAMEYYEESPEEALNLLRSVLSDHPDYLPTYFKAAHLLWENEEWDEAEGVFQRGVELAEKLQDEKATLELKSAYQNFQFDRD